MERKALKALKASIKKWDKNVLAKTTGSVKAEGDDCPLCDEFANCNGCPVSIKTGKPSCRETPYYTARSALYSWIDGFMSREEAIAKFKEEADFLRSLLPEGEAS